MSWADVRTNIVGVGQSVVGNIVCAAASALCVAKGLISTPDFSNPGSWPLWVGLTLSFGTVIFVGSSANTMRLWWNIHTIKRARGDQFTVILADLVGDHATRTQKLNVRDSLKHYLGSDAHILSYPQALVIGEGHENSEFAKAHAQAQKILKNKRGDLLIWGRVKSADTLSLYFTPRSAATNAPVSYKLLNDEERPLELPLKFDRDLGAAIAARVVEVSDALIDRQGHFLTPYADRFAQRIASLAAHPRPDWPAAARGAILQAFGVAKLFSGVESGETAALRQAVAAFEHALQDRTREETPLEWATTQNSLSTALWRLGQRETDTWHLNRAVIASEKALEVLRGPDRPVSDGAAAQVSLGNALHTLGERERNTNLVKQAITAFQSALHSSIRENAPHVWATAQNNLGNAFMTLGTYQNDIASFKDAATAFQAALTERTRERRPREWATTLSNLGNAFLGIGLREKGPDRLQDAVTAYEAALEEGSSARVPPAWVRTKRSLGIALRTLGTRVNNVALLQRSITAFHEALTKQTREGDPFNWAVTQFNLAQALESVSRFENHTASLVKAVEAFDRALTSFEEANREHEAHEARQSLANARLALARRQSRS